MLRMLPVGGGTVAGAIGANCLNTARKIAIATRVMVMAVITIRERLVEMIAVMGVIIKLCHLFKIDPP